MTMQGCAVGNVGKDGELKQVGNDQVLNFSVATEHYDSKTKKRETEWVEVAFWGKRAASVAKFITKGRPVTVVGEFTIRRFEHNGEKRASVQLRASDVILQGGQRDEQGPGVAKATDYPPNWDEQNPGGQLTKGL